MADRFEGIDPRIVKTIGDEPHADWELDLLRNLPEEEVEKWVSHQRPTADEVYRARQEERRHIASNLAEAPPPMKVTFRDENLRASLQKMNLSMEKLRIALGGPPPEPPKYPKLAKIGEVKKKDGWDWYWLFWVFGMVITGFAIPEANAILNKQKGDTLSENIREWLKTDTPGGGASWLAIVGLLFTLVTWLMGHILEWWP